MVILHEKYIGFPNFVENVPTLFIDILTALAVAISLCRLYILLKADLLFSKIRVRRFR